MSTTGPRRHHWKFVFADLVVYKVGHQQALAYYFCLRDKDTFDVFTLNKGEWLYRFTNDPQEICSCGRYYTDSPDAEEFKYQEALYVPRTTIDEIVNIMQSPIMCIMCYYSKEHAARHWCPRWVQERLEN